LQAKENLRVFCIQYQQGDEQQYIQTVALPRVIKIGGQGKQKHVTSVRYRHDSPPAWTRNFLFLFFFLFFKKKVGSVVDPRDTGFKEIDFFPHCSPGPFLHYFRRGYVMGDVEQEAV
jgi:hypothetical protein